MNKQLKFRYVLIDSWYLEKENFEFFTKRRKHLIVALKDIRLVVMNEHDEKQGLVMRIETVSLVDRQVVHDWLKGYCQEALFTSQDGRIGKKSNSVFMDIFAMFELGCLKVQTKLNHFALRAKLLIKATYKVYQQLQALSS